jgi:hypothetical protein
LSKDSASKRARERIPKSTRRTEKIGSKWKKDTILTERSYRSIETKGFKVLKRSKRTGF